MLVHQILGDKALSGVVTISPKASLSEAAQLLSARKIGAVVVSTDGTHAQGILSERDIVRELGRHGPSCLSELVETVMTSKLVTCRRDETVDGVMNIMSEGRFRHLPVVEDGEMIGLISIGDVVKARLGELSMERNALEGMIMGH